MLQREPLQQLLAKELALLTDLNQLSLLKKDALLTDDFGSLEEIVLKEEALSRKLRSVDDACSPQVQFFLKSQNKEEFPTEVYTLLEQIKQLIYQFQSNNQFNQTLIQDSLSLVQFSLNSLVPPSDGGAPVYGASGQVVKVNPNNTGLDFRG